MDPTTIQMTENTKNWLFLEARAVIHYWQKWKSILHICFVLSTHVKDSTPSGPATQYVHILTKTYMQEHLYQHYS